MSSIIIITVVVIVVTIVVIIAIPQLIMKGAKTSHELWVERNNEAIAQNNAARRK
jgi:hypothetical protein